MLKKLNLTICTFFLMLVLTSCGKDLGENYKTSDLFKYSEKIQDYVVKPDVAQIMNTNNNVVVKNDYNYCVKTLSTTDNEFNETSKDYETLPDSLIELESAASYLANKIKPSLNMVVKELKEENVWISSSADKYVKESYDNTGIAHFARLNTTDSNVFEYISVSYEPQNEKVIGLTHIKLTNTLNEFEPIVEYAAYELYDDNLLGDYLYYKPGSQIYAYVGKRNSVNEYYCINEDGHFTAYLNSMLNKTIIDGNEEDGFVELKYNEFEENDKTYTYYKDNHKIMTLNQTSLMIDLYNAKNVEVIFGEPSIEKIRQVTEFDYSGYLYEKVKRADSFVLPDDVVYEELSNYDKETKGAKGYISTNIVNDNMITNVGYYVTEEGFLKIPFTPFDNLSEFTNREEFNNLSDKLFSKENFDLIYDIYIDYFNIDSTLLNDCKNVAFKKIDNIKSSFDYKEFEKNIKTMDCHYMYSLNSKGQLIDNYESRIELPDLSKYYIANHIIGGDYDLLVNEGNATYIFESSFNSYSIGSNSYNVIYGLENNGNIINLAKSSKPIQATSNYEDGITNVSFSLKDVVETLISSGKEINGRYELVSFYQDAATNENIYDSLTSVPTITGEHEFMDYCLEVEGKFYNVKVHTTCSRHLDFDYSYYLLIEEIK